ncbi:hypothetical protein MKX03_008040 [Papaver bracteatum]|nr:hypothetical protein MKX03_008040 [Papaver bracteatum]
MVNGILNIFKKKTAPKEALMESKREMSTERKLVNKIKKTVKFGNKASSSKMCLNSTLYAYESAITRILARQLVCLRKQITHLQGSRAQIRGVATHTHTMYATTAISTGMKGETKAMKAMNRQMAPTKQAKVIKEFQKQYSQMDMTKNNLSKIIREHAQVMRETLLLKDAKPQIRSLDITKIISKSINDVEQHAIKSLPSKDLHQL